MYSHVNDVVTDRSYALAGFLVSTLFVFPPANPSKFSHCLYSDIIINIVRLLLYELLVVHVLVLGNVTVLDYVVTSILLNLIIYL